MQLKIETQDVKVLAFRFYERMGCDLKSADPYGKTHPHEFQFL